jgi:hypothetical protein
MHLWVFLVANHFRLRLKRTRGKRFPGTWELLQLYTRSSMVMEHTLKETPTPHMTLGVLTQNSPSVGEIGERLAATSFRTKEYPS